MNAKSLTGAAGVFYVAAELSFRGMIALPTVRNTAGADILVTNSDGTRFAQLQVKTSSRKVDFWPLGTKTAEWTGENCWYVFVRRTKAGFEAFMEKADRVAAAAAKADALALSRGCKKWGSAWSLRGIYADPDAEERTRRQWAEFSL